jgi:hypothetical protein
MGQPQSRQNVGALEKSKMRTDAKRPGSSPAWLIDREGFWLF